LSLMDRIVGLKRQGRSPQEIAHILGYTRDQVMAKLADPLAPDPPPSMPVGAMSFEGDYDPVKSYKKGAAVKYLGQTYVFTEDAGPAAPPYAAPLYVGGAAHAGAITVPKPAALAVGDFMLGFRSGSNGGAPLPSGWTQLFSQEYAGWVHARLFWRLATAADVAATGFAWGGSGETGIIRAYRGVDTGKIHVHSVNYNNGSGNLAPAQQNSPNGYPVKAAAFIGMRANTGFAIGFANDAPNQVAGASTTAPGASFDREVASGNIGSGGVFNSPQVGHAIAVTANLVGAPSPPLAKTTAL
jgi:hypothetical protein